MQKCRIRQLSVAEFCNVAHAGCRIQQSCRILRFPGLIRWLSIPIAYLFTFHHKQINMARRVRINATSIRQLIGALIIILKLQ